MSTKPYSGAKRKLVLAFDVGTTFSGISYAILTPGEVPKIYGVNRFPAQENVGGDSKIPTILYYDGSGKARALGAEALDPRSLELAEQEGWKKVEWFKMHLRPKSMGSSIDGTKIPSLPKGKTVVEVFADFLRYLFACSRTYITETHAAGTVLWDSLADNIHFILTHPNGWQGPQQTRMRKSAIVGGLVPDTPAGRSRVQFVTEGEASLHFCIHSGLASELVKLGENVVILDAGGGTIDVSSYRFSSMDPVKVEESAMPECKAQGSVFVTRRAHEYLKTFLRGSKYGTAEDIDAIAEVFDKTTKRIFRDNTESSYIKFAAPKDKDIQFNIRGGQLKLDGSVVAEFFERSIQSVMDAIGPRNARTSASKAIFLVGGFAASPWLFTQLQQRLAGSEFSLCRPDSHTNKAVADGAISFYLDHFVTERVARTTLGVGIHTHFDETNAEHRQRSASKYRDLSGTLMVPHAFDTLLKKDTLVSEVAEFRRPYARLALRRDALLSTNSPVLSYIGNRIHPRWVDKEPENFVTYCEIDADMSNAANALLPYRSLTGGLYYKIKYEIVILFGLTETQALVAWKEDGVEKRSPATVVYYDAIMEDNGDDDPPVDELDKEEEEEGPFIRDQAQPTVKREDVPRTLRSAIKREQE